MKDLSFKKKLCLVLLIFVISGIFGFIYETIFYRIDLGYFIKRGSTFGPWIPIYGFGGLCIFFLTKKYENKPLLVFILSMIISGILEYLTGYFLNTYFHLRLWDYNTEIWNFGNLNGYICLRSVLFFGISGIFLIKGIIPFLKKYLIDKKYSLVIAIILSSLFIFDMIIYLILRYNI